MAALDFYFQVRFIFFNNISVNLQYEGTIQSRLDLTLMKDLEVRF